MPIEPTQEQIAELTAIAGTDRDGPVVMLNLNRFHEEARYEEDPADGLSTDVSGAEAYGRYGAVALSTLERVGGKILWYTEAASTVIGDESSDLNEVVAVWYPSRAAFLDLALAPDITVALVHRRAGLERATIICCPAATEPVLGILGAA